MGKAAGLEGLQKQDEAPQIHTVEMPRKRELEEEVNVLQSEAQRRKVLFSLSLGLRSKESRCFL